MDQTFFGYSPADRITLHEQLFDVVWHGEGRWNFDTMYHMPLPMRRFWISKLNDKLIAANSNHTPQNKPAVAKSPVSKRST